MAERTCADRIGAHLESRLDDLRAYRDAGDPFDSGPNEDLGPFYEYGLSADYVEPDTFNDQPEGFFRFQISWGGPSDEFRYFVSPHRWGLYPYRVEYRFHDWYDGAGRDLTGDDRDVALWAFHALWPEPEAAIKAQA